MSFSLAEVGLKAESLERCISTHYQRSVTFLPETKIRVGVILPTAGLMWLRIQGPGLRSFRGVQFQIQPVECTDLVQFSLALFNWSLHLRPYDCNLPENPETSLPCSSRKHCQPRLCMWNRICIRLGWIL